MQQIAKAKLEIDYGADEWRAVILTTPDVSGEVASYYVNRHSVVYEEYDSLMIACIASGDVFDYALAHGTKETMSEAQRTWGDDAKNYRR